MRGLGVRGLRVWGLRVVRLKGLSMSLGAVCLWLYGLILPRLRAQRACVERLLGLFF